ncbi:50S ribosomal protein L30P, partial [mine drainage metagenome]
MADKKIIAAIRVRGRVNVRHDIAETLERLRLKRPNNCIILSPTDSYRGMLKMCNNYIAYGEVDEDIISKLLKKVGIDSIEGADKEQLKKAMPIRLHPP